MHHGDSFSINYAIISFLLLNTEELEIYLFKMIALSYKVGKEQIPTLCIFVSDNMVTHSTCAHTSISWPHYTESMKKSENFINLSDS